MVRFVLVAVWAFLLGASPAFAALETTTTLTFDPRDTIVDSFSTVFIGVPGDPTSPVLNIYGGPDITPGSTRFGGTSTSEIVTGAYFFMGVTGAAGSARELVLGVNQSLAGQSFDSLFPSYSEIALIDAIVRLNAGTAPAFGSEFELASGFQSEYASQYAFGLGGTGYLTAFSPGQEFGTIDTSQTTVEIPGSVPEPVTWLMLIAGVGMIGAAVRRRPCPLPIPA